MEDDQFGILILLGSYAIWNTMLTLIIIVKKVIVCIYLCGGGKWQVNHAAAVIHHTLIVPPVKKGFYSLPPSGLFARGFCFVY